MIQIYKCKVDGITYSYEKVEDGAVIFLRRGEPAISPSTVKGKICIPDKIDQLQVIGIGDWAFYGCKGIKSVAIPSSVSYIGKYAFSQCTGLEEITIPRGVQSIEEATFEGCSRLKSVTLPEGLDHIWISAFSGCAFKTIKIPESVLTVEGLAFFKCKNLESITIPANVIHWGEAATASSGVKHYYVDPNNSCFVVQNDVLLSKDKKTAIDCPGGIRDCITIPKGVTEIEEQAFVGCQAKKVILPKSVRRIKEFAFSSCEVKSIVIPNGVTVIEDSAFEEACIESISIPNSVKEIGSCAFYRCSKLKEVEIPNAIHKIGSGAFSECKALKRIVFKGDVGFKNASPEMFPVKERNPVIGIYPRKYAKKWKSRIDKDGMWEGLKMIEASE